MVEKRKNFKHGYSMLIFLFAIAVLGIGLMIAFPLWNTQIQREKEEELIFRGKQYADAVGRYRKSNPNSYPESLEELVEKKFLRRKYKDPMTPDGKWNVILSPDVPNSRQNRNSSSSILVVSENMLGSINNPKILGVISRSSRKSKKIYNDQNTYNNWFFYYGYSPQSMPKIITYKKD